MAETACPVAEVKVEGTPSAQDVADAERLALTAQRLYDDGRPEAIRATFGGLQTDLENRFEMLHDYEPLKAERNVWRHMRAAGWAALTRATVNDELFRRVTPHLSRSDSLVRSDMTDGTSDHEHWQLPEGIAGTPYETFIKTGAAWLLDVSGVTWRAIEADLDHPRRSLLDAMRPIQAACHDSCKAWNGEVEARSNSRPLFQPSRRLEDSWRSATLENLGNAAKILHIAALSYTRRANPRPSTEELTRNALADVVRLGWPASTKHSAANRMLGLTRVAPLAQARTRTEISAACMPEERHARPLNGKGEYWSAFALQNGPWTGSAEGICAGNILMLDHDPQNAKAFFVAAGVDSEAIMTTTGAYRQTAVVLSLGAHIAKETIYAAWPAA